MSGGKKGKKKKTGSERRPKVKKIDDNMDSIGLCADGGQGGKKESLHRNLQSGSPSNPVSANGRPVITEARGWLQAFVRANSGRDILLLTLGAAENRLTTSGRSSASSFFFWGPEPLNHVPSHD